MQKLPISVNDEFNAKSIRCFKLNKSGKAQRNQGKSKHPKQFLPESQVPRKSEMSNLYDRLHRNNGENNW